MNQENTINKALIEMTNHRMYDAKQESWMRGYLEMIYGAGFDEGRTFQARNRIMVGRYDERGNCLATYPSITIAAQRMGVSRSAVSGAIAGRQPRSAGYYWKYINQTK